jgi:hypothetical protein
MRVSCPRPQHYSVQMIGISVKADVRACTASLNDIARKQLPFAVSAALNDVARQVQTGERANLKAVLRHPRPFTANSVFYKKATKAKWVAIVYIKDITAKYFMPFEFGGVHVLPGKALLGPKNVTLDPYGQLRKNTPKRLAKRKDVFVGTVKGVPRLAGVDGWWLRTRDKANRNVHHLVLMIRFGIALPVKTHLNFHQRAAQIVKATFAAAFSNVIATAVKKKP